VTGEKFRLRQSEERVTDMLRAGSLQQARSVPQDPSPTRSDARDNEPDAAQLLGHAVDLLRNEQIEEAEEALRGVLEIEPEQPDALHFLGVVRHTQGRTDDAVALIRKALAQLPDHAGAWNNLGNVLLSAGRIDEATQAYEQGVQVARGHPDSADALNNLSTVYRKQGRPADAEAACRRALEVRPDFGNAWYNLSQALMAQGNLHEGLLANSRAITLWPHHLQARDQVIRALVLLGERVRAAQMYRDWLAEEPDNPLVQHHLAACLGEAQPERASDAYVQKVFDSFAASFDAKLETLHYRAPELVAQALHAAAGEPRAALQVIDAGCGTGLCGPLVKPWAKRLAGCDLSVGMLRRARERRVYDVLHQAELMYYLDTQPETFDAVISADTLCYFGSLDKAMAASKRSLRAGGWLVFTVEALPEGSTDEHRLQPNGRYAHAPSHVRSAIRHSGLTLLGLHPATLRMEAGLPVAGWLVTARSD
jgi:predicted TPR repeat methyltransferase